MVVNYASSAGAAEEVAEQIKASGGDAIVVGADLAKGEDIDRCDLRIEPLVFRKTSSQIHISLINHAAYISVTLVPTD